MLRNKEIKCFAAAFSAISIAAVIIGFVIGTEAGILITAFAAAAAALFFLFTKARYNSIAKISEQIDVVLHNAEYLYISDTEEGELAILQSEITKMLLRIREQNAALMREKQHLADSMADIAHQLRTPLTSLNTILSLIDNTTDEDEKRILLRQAQKLFVTTDWLLTSLLKLSQLDAGIVEFQNAPIKVADLIREAADPILILLELHNISLRCDIPDDAFITGDPKWLAQAIQNILKNCTESIGENGSIKISCEDNALYSEIRIHDSGKGIDKETLPHIFDRFYRGKNSVSSGYGIGFALCRTIIVNQGGTITAKNHPDGGALFLIRFQK